MLILTIKTDNPEAEIGLFNSNEKLDYQIYAAHRTLAETLHLKIEEMLKKHNYDWNNLEGIICFEGPGSFTGLRIGLVVANTLSYSLRLPIIGTRSDDWLDQGIAKLLAGEDQGGVMPHYGREPHITKQKK